MYEVYALKYGTLAGRPADALIMDADPHEGPMTIDYFIWACVSPERTVIVDIGFSAKVGAERGRTALIEPIDALRQIGIDAAAVEDVVITHFHYDHVGNIAGFPKARFHIQDREMAYATGRQMTDKVRRVFFEPSEVCEMVHNVYQDRVVFHDGDGEVAPGLTVHHLGGHTAGLQCVRVWTQRGWVVLASDAAHLYEHYRNRRIFPNHDNADDVLAAYDRLTELADSPDHVVPGHDPAVFDVYPAATEALAGKVIRLD